MEGVIEHLDPSISIIDMAEPFGRKLVREKFNTRRLRGKVFSGVSDLVESIIELPGQARLLTSIISKGKLKLEVSVPEVEQVMKKLDQISNRLSFSIVLLAFSILMVGLIVGAALSEQKWNIPIVEIGLAVAALMVVWFIIHIIRSGRF